MTAFLQELIHTGIYKRSQGRITRQVTFAAIAITVALGLWRLSGELEMAEWARELNATAFHLWLPGMLLISGLWIAYRIVNVPSFADFLIAVEAEMNKVSWPSRAELFRASLVVLFTIFALAAILAIYDFVWRFVFTKVLFLF